MWYQFFLENAHFAINLIAALAFFTVFWLYWDAWTQSRRSLELIKFSGFLLLSLSFLAHAVFIESSVLSTTFFGGRIEEIITPGARILGYILVILGLAIDPLQPHPKEEKVLAIGLWPLAFRFEFLYPVLAGLAGLLYLRRATIGLENHLKKVSLSFFALAFSEFLSLGFLLRSTGDVNVYNFVAPFGPLWIIQHLTLLLAVFILLKWGFVYLFKRFNTQIFIILNTAILIIFLLTTVSFTGLLTKNIQDETLARLETDVRVLLLSIESKKSESLSDAQVIAQDSGVIAAIAEEEKGGLALILQEFLLTKKESFLLIVDADGKVLARGEDKERFGDSLSDDPVVKRALSGESAASIVSKDAVLAPEISIRAGAPIKNREEVVGAVVTGTVIDSAFVDGIKAATGLEASIYSGNVLSATTLVNPDGELRPLGIKEENGGVKSKVLEKGENFVGAVSILNTPYFASFLSLKDVDETPVGMLFVGKPQIGVFQTAGRAIESTFLVTAILMMIAVFPAYFISKYITSQIS